MTNETKTKVKKICVTALAALLAIAAILYILSDDRVVPKQYADSLRVYTIIAVFISFVLFIFYRYAFLGDKEDKKCADDARKIKDAVLIIIALGFVMRIVLSVTAPQCNVDTNLFKYWGTRAADGGLLNIYKGNSNVDYPPVYIYVLWFLSEIAKLFKLRDTGVYTMMVKLPSILADCGIAFFVYKNYCKKLSKNWTVFFMLAWMFNPLSVIDSACWGQVDAILAFLLLLGCRYIEKEKFAAASVWMAIGVLFKPQTIILLPILFYALIKSKKFKNWWQAAAAFISTFIIVSLPFDIVMGMKEITVFGKNLNLPWIFSLYFGTAAEYDYASVNALNFWFAAGQNWVKDSTEFAGLTLYKWGMISIVISASLIWVLYLISKKRDTLPYIMGATLLSMVVTFGPRMHERYFFPVIVLLFAAMIKDNDKKLFGIYAGTSFFGFITVAEIMTDLDVGAKEDMSYYWPQVTPFRMVLALGNILFCLLLVIYTLIYTFRHSALENKENRIYIEREENVTEEVK